MNAVRALAVAVAVFITGFGSTAAIVQVVADRRAGACRQALSAELAGLAEGISVYTSDPPACARYSRGQQRAWLIQITSGR